MTAAVVKTDFSVANVSGVDDLAARWIKFLRVGSEKTRQTYDAAIRQLIKYLAANNITQPARTDLANWLDGLKLIKDASGKKIGGKSASTIQLYAVATRKFFKWLADENLYKNIADGLKSTVKVDTTTHKKKALKVADAAKLIQSVSTHKNSKSRKFDDKKSLRDTAMVMMMMFSGCRTVELHRANVVDFIKAKQNDNLMPIQRKGHSEKDSETLLSTQLVTAIEKYLETRGIDTGNLDDKTRDKSSDYKPLFATVRKTTIRNADKSVKVIVNCDERLSTQSISKLTKVYLRDIGKGGEMYTAHSLRHTCATILRKAGTPIEKVQQVLGHKSATTTAIYDHDNARADNRSEQLMADIVGSFRLI